MFTVKFTSVGRVSPELKSANLFSKTKWLISFLYILVGLTPQLSYATDVSGNQSGTWTRVNSPYIVVGNVTVPSGQTLTIEPGVVVKFNTGLGMTINGSLIANGNITDSIRFTTSNSSPAPGQWKQLYFSNSPIASQLSFSIIEYAGSSGVCPIQMRPNTTLVHHNNKYLNNSIEAIAVEGGSISGNQTWWYDGGEPLQILGDVRVTNSGMLTVSPGVEVKFDSAAGLQIQGELNAVGEADSLITFTSWSGTGNGWDGIYFYILSGKPSTMTYCVIEKAGQNGWGQRANLCLSYLGSTGSLMVNNCTLRSSGEDGVYVSGSDAVTITGSKIESNGRYGVYSYNSKMTLTGNTFKNNLLNPLRTTVNKELIHYGNTYGNNGIEAIGIEGGSISGNQTWWYDGGEPLQILGDVRVTNSGMLTVSPGVDVKFDSAAGLHIQGQLNTVGKVDSLITFTSWSGTSNGWDGINFYILSGKPSTMTYCVIEKAGQSGWGQRANLYLNYLGNTGSLTVNNCVLRGSGGDGMYVSGSDAVTITGSKIESNGRYGVYSYNSKMILTGNTFKSNVSYPLWISVTKGTVRYDNTYSENGIEAIGVEGGSISSNQTWWYDGGEPFRILGDVRVTNSGMLTISPGVEVKFDSAAGLQIQGELNSVGKADSLITFTSWSGTSNGWDGINFYILSGKPSTMTNCVIEKAGQSGWGQRANLYLNYLGNTGSLTVNNCVLRGSGGDGMYVSGSDAVTITGSTIESNGQHGLYSYNSKMTLTGNTFKSNISYPLWISVTKGTVRYDNTYSENGIEAIGIEGGSISDNQTWWYDGGEPLRVLGDIRVSSSLMLTIKPGVEVKFDNAAGLQIQGQLNTLGKADSLITFTSWSGESDGWDGMYFYILSGKPSTMTYCVVEKAGQSGWGQSANLYLSYSGNGSLTVNNCILRISGGDGIYVSGSDSVTITGSMIESNGRYGVYINGSSPIVKSSYIIDNDVIGIYISGYSKVVVGDTIGRTCHLYRNGGYDIFNDSPLGYDVHARNNYWKTTDSIIISSRIYDNNDNSSKGKVFFLPTAPSQYILTLHGRDNGGEQDSIKFGFNYEATFCVDASLGEQELSPFPSKNIFDFRWVNPRNLTESCFGNGLDIDLRPFGSTEQIDTFKVQFQPGSGGFPFTLSWSSDLNKYCDSINIIYSGSSTGEYVVNMLASATHQIVDSTISSFWIIKYGIRDTTGSNAPKLLSPPYGSTNLDTTLILIWNYYPGAINYHFQLSTDPNFSSTIIDDSTLTITSRQVEQLSRNTTYFWRVNAKNFSGISDWSAVWMFKTSKNPESIPFGSWYTFAVERESPFIAKVIVPVTGRFFIMVKKSTHYGYADTWSGNIKISRDGKQIAVKSGNTDYDFQIYSLSPGIYQIEIQSYQFGEGILKITTAFDTLQLGQWRIGEILRPYGYDWMQVDIQTGQDTLFLTTEGFGAGSRLEVYYDSLSNDKQYWQFTNLWVTGWHIEGKIIHPPIGRYYLRYMDSAVMQGDTTQIRQYMIFVDTHPINQPSPTHPIITSLSTYRGGTTGYIIVQIFGSGFDSNTFAFLERRGYKRYLAKFTNLDASQSSLYALFDLSDVPRGNWEFGIINSDSTTAYAPFNFEVQSGGSTQLYLEIFGRNQIRVGRWSTLFLKCFNNGSITAKEIVLTFVLPIQVRWKCSLPEPIEFDSIGWKNEFPIDSNYKVLFFRIPYLNPGQTVILDIKLLVSSLELLPQEITLISEEQVLKVQGGKLETFLRARGSFNSFVAAEAFSSVKEQYIWYRANEGGRSFREWSPQAQKKFFEEEYLPKYKKYYGVIQPHPPTAAEFTKESFVSWLLKELFGQAAQRGFDLSNELGSDFPWVTLFFGQKLGSVYVEDPYKNDFGDLANMATHSMEGVNSATPEDKYGPNGYEPGNSNGKYLHKYLKAQEPLSYRIDFWNKEDATAPAQEVFIKDTLDQDFDLTKLNFKEFGFLRWTIPLDGGQYFNTNVDLRPDMNLIVNVEGTLNLADRVISWTFRSLDPSTGQLPEDPLVGFLPSIDSTGYQMGWVEYTILPRQNISTGTQIINQAFVNFDGVGPWNPAPKEAPFLNTIDAGLPTSWIDSSVVHIDSTSYQLSWNSSDDSLGSGIVDYTIYVSEDSTEYIPWLKNTSDTSSIFTGVYGHTYHFYSIARDGVGNIEVPPDSCDISLEIKYTSNEPIIPTVFNLFHNYPNPFNLSTTIQYDIPKASRVKIKIYDILGREVFTLVDKDHDAGRHKEIWRGLNNHNQSVSSGVYFIRMQASDYTKVQKMMILK